MNLPMTLSAYKVNQPTGNGRSIYITKILVKYLIGDRDFKVDTWESSMGILPEQGYQRRPTRSRLLGIAKFIAEEVNPIFPTSVLLSSRETLEFKSRDGVTGDLIIKHPLWIVDGQHRVYGLRLAVGEKDLKEWEEYELPVVILDNFDKKQETLQFYILNVNQKRVSTDLAQRLIRKIGLEKQSGLAYRPGDEWISRALQVVDLLNQNTEENNVWHSRIRLPNAELKPVHIINQTSMVSSLKPLLKEGALQGYKSDMVYKIIRNYWSAIRSCIPEAFQLPREYVIQKTPGVFALHDLANRMLIKNIAGSDLTENSFKAVLKNVFVEAHGDEVYWRARGDGAALHNSMKGFKFLANVLENNLPKEALMENIKV